VVGDLLSLGAHKTADPPRKQRARDDSFKKEFRSR